MLRNTPTAPKSFKHNIAPIPSRGNTLAVDIKMDTPTPLLSIGDKSTKSSIDEPSPSKLYKALTHLSYRDPPAVSSTLSPSPTPSELADADADLSEKIVEELYPSTWKQYTILLTLNLAMFVDVVSGSALNVVLPHVAKDLGLAGGDISWM